jgi:hypothetical protein
MRLVRRYALWVLIAIVVMGDFGYCAHLMATCEGHVVRNALDWPVCIK